MKPEIVRVALPDEVRGIYWTALIAQSDRADELLAFMGEEGLNAVVIDLKMDNGEVVTPSSIVLLKIAEQNIYRIARIPVMRDGVFAEAHPELALKRAGGSFWRDSIGSVWLDPAAPEVADAAIELAREAHAIGFDEVQFDYVRFPSDGTISSIVYPVWDGIEDKVTVMQRFFESVGAAMALDGIPVSFDVFGMTFWSTNDYNIGQRLLDVYPIADFVSPMVYPSHYPSGFEGYANPALYPYEIVKRSLDRGAEMLETELAIPKSESRKKFRPWLQAFDMGAVYDDARVREQIRAARDAGASGWILWNARNVYESMHLDVLE